MIREYLVQIFSEYLSARTQPFAGHPIRKSFDGLTQALALSEPVERRNESSPLKVDWSVGKGNWARVPWIALMNTQETNSTQQGVYCVFLFRQDMTGVYLTFNQGVTNPKATLGASEGRKQIRARAQELRKYCVGLEAGKFLLDDGIDLRTDKGLGADYEDSTVAYKLYEAADVPSDQEIIKDLERVLSAYDRYLESKSQIKVGLVGDVGTPSSLGLAVTELVESISAMGFVFEPWQVATYVTALRTKPFIILAGVSGTGKSKLPSLVCESTGGACKLLSVRPDWTDSSEILGYVSLDQVFQPGSLLCFVQEATKRPDQHHVLIIDEMNLARVEHYFAEILSRMEDRHRVDDGGYASGPLWAGQKLTGADTENWEHLGLPPNLAIVGTVNMDESAHGFSRKVLDRAFTLELSDVDLRQWQEGMHVSPKRVTWPSTSWYPKAIRLGDLREVQDHERESIQKVIGTLSEINHFLAFAQLQVGYRIRDEVALFVLHAQDVHDSFVTREGSSVDPLDVALEMKVLPRLVGGSNAIRYVLLHLISWAIDGKAPNGDLSAGDLLKPWKDKGRPGQLGGAVFPRTAGRLSMMLDRMENEGFTSFWL